MRFEAILALGTLAACSDPPPPAATYDAPSHREAMNAFKSALVTDAATTASQVREFRESDMTPFGSAAGQVNNNNLIASRHGKLMVSALQRFKVVDCAWQPIVSKEVPKLARDRIKDFAPKAAYRCSYEVNYQLSPPIGKKFDIESAGYFFKTDDGFVFAGHYIDPYA